MSRHHAFVTILFLVVCALDVAAATGLPTAVVGIVGPALAGTWLGALVACGWPRRHRDPP